MTWWGLPALFALVGAGLLLFTARPESNEPHERLLLGLIGFGMVGVLIQIGIDALPPDRRAELDAAARSLESDDFPIDDSLRRLQSVQNAVATHLTDGSYMQVYENVSQSETLRYTVNETPGVAESRFCLEVTVTQTWGGPAVEEFRMPDGETVSAVVPYDRTARVTVTGSPTACGTDAGI